ncbi:hypothetical protein [Streptomyces sp. HUAS CX7]|uniref:hypothetical protein n=1 Tax=Streptomyces sp. HUAS CX7 TaxID=3062782 RepID=UPI0026EAA621|nr:hypothetical protein [Streptomyces sp. HUAS CX7]WKX22242.1 hypothetical protein Q3Y68_31025 [Streptomyces sp. HUAS CX7]
MSAFGGQTVPPVRPGGFCHFGKYNSAHDTAVMNVAGYLTAFQPEGGGTVTMGLSASQGRLGRDARNTITGGSVDNPGKEDGYANLL